MLFCVQLLKTTSWNVLQSSLLLILLLTMYHISAQSHFDPTSYNIILILRLFGARLFHGSTLSHHPDVPSWLISPCLLRCWGSSRSASASPPVRLVELPQGTHSERSSTYYTACRLLCKCAIHYGIFSHVTHFEGSHWLKVQYPALVL